MEKMRKKGKSSCDLDILWGTGFCEDSTLSIFAQTKFNRKKTMEKGFKAWLTHGAVC